MREATTADYFFPFVGKQECELSLMLWLIQKYCIVTYSMFALIPTANPILRICSKCGFTALQRCQIQALESKNHASLSVATGTSTQMASK